LLVPDTPVLPSALLLALQKTPATNGLTAERLKRSGYRRTDSAKKTPQITRLKKQPAQITRHNSALQDASGFSK